MALDIAVSNTVWVMFNNKPVELVVTKIIQTSILNATQGVEDKTDVYASFDINNKHDLKLNINEMFATRAELEAYVFEPIIL